MKRTYLFSITFVIMIIIFHSCSLFNKTADFTVYKEPLISGNLRNIPFQLNGVYLSLDSISATYVFYADGSFRVMYPWHDGSVWKDPNDYLEKVLNPKAIISKERWGAYKVSDNTIVTQNFNRHNQEFYKRWISEVSLIVHNDTILEVISQTSYWSPYYLTNRIKLRFYPTDIKPDSSQAWYLNRRWYEENLHPTRQLSEEVD